ncbi:hypothetical protein [Nonomuraea sp. C10]|nr:hypothetical protein [Nonomuraea sp. C10]
MRQKVARSTAGEPGPDGRLIVQSKQIEWAGLLVDPDTEADLAGED